MLICEDWASGEGRIREFFQTQSDVSAADPDFIYGNCRITLTALEDAKNGIFSFPRTRVRMEGPEEELRVIYRRFFLRFLSAGG